MVYRMSFKDSIWRSARKFIASVVFFLLAGQALSASFTCGAGSSGYCLQDAIEAANTNAEPDIIILGPDIHRPASRLRYGDDNRVCLPPIESEIIIRGAGMNDTAVIVRPGIGDDCRVFQVYPSGRLTLEDLTVEGGWLSLWNESPDVVEIMGAAVYNAGVLVIERVAFRSNHAPYAGGALYNAPNAEAYLEDCEFTGNTVSSDYINASGSAIFNEGKLDMNRCLIAKNNTDGIDNIMVKAIANGRGLTTNPDVTMSIRNSRIESNIGGGVSNKSRAGSKLTIDASSIKYNSASFGGGVENDNIAVITNSTIAFNTSKSGGGGLATSSSLQEQSLTLINTTISGNYSMDLSGSSISTDQGGGGIFSPSGHVFIVNSTITSNRSQSKGGGLAIGFPNTTTQGEVLIKNSIVAGNVSERSTTDDCSIGSTYASIVLAGTNVLADGGGCQTEEGHSIIIPSNRIFRDVLDVLRDNGGPTETHALFSGSPAVDAADPVCMDLENQEVSADQRGYSRSRCDIGAFELNSENNIVINARLEGGGPDNRVNPSSNGRVRITLLSEITEGLELKPAEDIVRLTLKIGSANPAALEFLERDVNRDGILDLTVSVRARELGIENGDSKLVLKGSLINGMGFESVLPITTAGKHIKK